MLRYLQNQKPPLGSRIDWSHPLSRGLVGCWIFNEGMGNRVNDLSLNGNQGTVYGATWQDGGLYFDGADDYVVFSQASSINVPWTAEAWVYLSSRHSVGAAILDDGSVSLRAEQYNSDNVGVTEYGVADYSIAYSIPLQTWTHLVFVGVSGTIYVYVDGIQEGTINATLSCPIDIIGKRGGASSDYLHGIIRAIRVYNRALSAEEIRWLHLDPHCFIESPMRFYDFVVAPPAPSASGANVFVF